jgi:hypothetical protein
VVIVLLFQHDLTTERNGFALRECIGTLRARVIARDALLFRYMTLTDSTVKIPFKYLPATEEERNGWEVFCD